MKLFADPISTTSRPILMFLAEHRLPVEIVAVNLMDGAHTQPGYALLNPNLTVPTLVDGDFVLTESSAILKYLADEAGSDAYPRGARARARVNQAMDWFNTGFYRDFGYGLVYPQTFAHCAFPNATTQADVIRRGRERADFWLGVLNDHWLADTAHICGAEVSIADFLGAAYLSIGDWVGFDLGRHPHVARWMRTMRSRPSWAAANEAWNGLANSFRGQLAKTA